MMFLEVIRDLKQQNLDNESILSAIKQMVQEGKLSQNELDYAIEWLGQNPKEQNQPNTQVNNPTQQENPPKELTEQEQVNNLFGMKIL